MVFTSSQPHIPRNSRHEVSSLKLNSFTYDHLTLRKHTNVVIDTDSLYYPLLRSELPP